ncbi:glutamate decarboxylase [Candidatus Photodesmus blepharus]|uniref:Glutamate decarboxylase n=1 Tax=Candidatus Photodesmus blepharonis TaxID=1179155 RepID=A0A084CN38_9GAMM|nr:putative pyridoxal-dependent aspartate 1-decarboxylase [Candidatus Photodesmus blepharus]KEY91217.1 glutamate decarboxylase [Candidatus Photodesmus blepharus]
MVPEKIADVSLENILQIFTLPEKPDSTLAKMEKQISEDRNLFFSEHIISQKKTLNDMEQDFSNSAIPEQPEFISKHAQHLLDALVAHSAYTSSPSFVGHMTSALPYFLMSLSKIMIALNQNLVKIETSKAFTPLERQVLGMLHRLIYSKNETFYSKRMHNSKYSLGAFCSGGTIANITALWVARNNALKAQGNFTGIEKEGLFRAIQYYGYSGLAVLVSERAHYSLKKAADILGIGQEGLVMIKTDSDHRIDCIDLQNKITTLRTKKVKPFAIIGIAGTTETGNIDPLTELAAICRKENCHFHVDAAWGGATLMSNNHRHLLDGIELADSVTIDAHKQLYIPIGVGMVLFKKPDITNSIEYHAQYVLRKGSKDLGTRTLEGSRSGIVMLVYASMHIIGRLGYELLIDQSIEKAEHFASLINQQSDFELLSQPELCLLTYRYIPHRIQKILSMASEKEIIEINALINELTKFIQKRQRDIGKSFVSRTKLNPVKWKRIEIVAFRVVLANPLTTLDILKDILIEQRKIALQDAKLNARIRSLF